MPDLDAKTVIARAKELGFTWLVFSKAAGWRFESSYPLFSEDDSAMPLSVEYIEFYVKRALASGVTFPELWPKTDGTALIAEGGYDGS